MAIRPADTALREITQQVISDNPEVAERAKKIVNALLRGVEETIKMGDPQSLAVLQRAILPGLLKAMQDRQDDGESELQAAFDRVMSSVRGE